MSLQGMIDVRGADVTVRRATTAAGAGGVTQRTWSEHIEHTKVLIESVTAERAQRWWGQETEATFVAWCDPDEDIAHNDALIVNDGEFAGQRYKVVGDTRGSLGVKRRALGLVLAKSTETFGL